MSTHEFNKLRARAHTIEDFRRLAMWCQMKAEEYRTNGVNYEREARELNPLNSPQSHPKHPTRGESLHVLALRCEEMYKHWAELSSIYTAKAADMESHSLK